MTAEGEGGGFATGCYDFFSGHRSFVRSFVQSIFLVAAFLLYLLYALRFRTVDLIMIIEKGRGEKFQF